MRLSKYQPTNGVLSRAARASLFFLKHVINQKAPRHPLTCGSNLQFARLVDQSDPILLFKKKKKNPFIFLSMPFILFAILKKKMWGRLFLFYFHEPRSSQTIEPLSWDPEPLSHDLTKPSRDLLQAKIQATEPRYEPSRVEPRYLSYSYVNKLKGFIKITPWVWGGMLRNPT